jgi:hypothetical protein
MSDSRVKSLKSIQKKIIDEWGSSVMEDNELRTDSDFPDENMSPPEEDAPPKADQPE